LFDVRGKESVGGAGMTEAEERLRRARRIVLRARIGSGGNVALAIRPAVAIERDSAVGAVRNGYVNQLGRIGGFGRRGHILGAMEELAAGAPFARLALAEDDRVES